VVNPSRLRPAMLLRRTLEPYRPHHHTGLWKVRHTPVTVSDTRTWEKWLRRKRTAVRLCVASGARPLTLSPVSQLIPGAVSDTRPWL
jgi:hypothetical protein